MIPGCQNIITNYWPASGIVNGRVCNYTDGFNNGSDEDQSWQACYDCTITKMVIKLALPPGTGKQRRFTLRQDGSDTPLIITFSDNQTELSMSGSVVFGTPDETFDLISIKEELLNDATDSAFSVSLVALAASDRQVIVTGRRWSTFWNQAFHNPIFNNNSVRWNPGSGGGILTTNQERSGFESLFSSPGTLKNIRWLVDVVPAPDPSTNKYLLALGSSHASYPIQIDKTFYGEDTVDSFSKTAGQYDSFFRNILNFDTINLSNGWHTMDFIPTNAGHRIFNCDLLPWQNSVPTYHSGVGMVEGGDGGQVPAQLAVEPFTIIPTSGTITNLYIDTFVAPTAAKPIVFTIRKNGVDTNLTVTVSNPSTSGNNTSVSIPVVEGDLISIKVLTDDVSVWTSLVKPKVAWTFVATNPLETPIVLCSFGKSPSFNPSVLVCTALCAYFSGGFARKMVTSVSGIDHLEGQTVDIVQDGILSPDTGQAVSGGTVTLSERAAVVHVGLPYTGKLQLLPLGGDGQTVNETKERKVYSVVMRLWKSLGGKFGKDDDHLYPLEYLPQDDVLFTGDMHDVPFESSVDDYWSPVLVQDEPLPFMLLATVIKSEIFEDK